MGDDSDGAVPDGFLDDLRDGGLTYDEISRKYGKNRYYAKKILNQLPVEHESIGRGGKKRFFLKDDEEVNHSEVRRVTSDTKQTITKKANEYISKMENEIKQYRRETGDLVPSVQPKKSKHGEDLVIHRTDDHFGDKVVDINGEVIFNSEIAEKKVRVAFDNAMAQAKNREDLGHDIDTVHLLLGGDIVTNEAIYDGQHQNIDEYIQDQLNRASGVYIDQLERLSNNFDFVQVVCQSGNHGEMRVDGSSEQANVDSFLYDRLEMIAKRSGLDNVKFVKSDRKSCVNFSMRGWTGHLRHGHHAKNHIGTSSPQSDWSAWINEYGFDVAYRGHYHTHKVEYRNKIPIIMGPSIKPSDDYEATMGIFGESMSYIHGVSDRNPLAWIDYIGRGQNEI